MSAIQSRAKLRSCFLLVLALLVAVGAGAVFWTRLASARFVRQIDEEVSRVIAQSRIYRDHCPTPDGKSLWYVSPASTGRRLHRLDLSTLREEIVFPELEVGRAYGWSADNRWLAFTVLGERVEYADFRQQVERPQVERLVFYDANTGDLSRASTGKPIIDADAGWLDSHTLLFTRYDCVAATRTNFWMDVLTGQTLGMAAPNISLVAIDSNHFCYSDGLNLFIQKTQTPSANRVSRFRKGDFDSPRWVRYHAVSESFLFCARPKDSDSRFLYRVARTNGDAQQVSFVDTYNGQWLFSGEGVAYVANDQNRFNLAIRPNEIYVATNLFLKGGVDNYTASPFGPLIYCTASVGDEPLALWEYQYQSGQLRKLTGDAQKKAESPDLPVVEFQLPREDGSMIPCYQITPAKKQEVRGVVIYVPAQSGQFKRLWESESQLLARMGYVYVAVDYHGCDGFGRAYAAANDLDAGVEDVLAVRRHLAAQFKSKLPNFYLFSQSSGAAVADSLLNTHPQMWRGAVFKQAGVFFPKSSQTSKFPRVLILMGTYDSSFEAARADALAAQERGVAVKFVSLNGAGHTIPYYPHLFAEQERQILRFLADDL